MGDCGGCTESKTGCFQYHCFCWSATIWLDMMNKLFVLTSIGLLLWCTYHGVQCSYSLYSITYRVYHSVWRIARYRRVVVIMVHLERRCCFRGTSQKHTYVCFLHLKSTCSGDGPRGTSSGDGPRGWSWGVVVLGEVLGERTWRRGVDFRGYFGGTDWMHIDDTWLHRA